MPRILLLISAFVGVLLLCIAIASVIMVRQFLASARSAPGTVVEIVRSEDSEGGTNYNPKVRYTVDDKTFEFTSSISTNPPAYQVNQKVSVVYSPAAPGKGRLDVWWEHYFVAMICGFLGIVFGAIGLFGFLFSFRLR